MNKKQNISLNNNLVNELGTAIEKKDNDKYSTLLNTKAISMTLMMWMVKKDYKEIKQLINIYGDEIDILDDINFYSLYYNSENNTLADENDLDSRVNAFELATDLRDEKIIEIIYPLLSNTASVNNIKNITNMIMYQNAQKVFVDVLKYNELLETSKLLYAILSYANKIYTTRKEPMQFIEWLVKSKSVQDFIYENTESILNNNPMEVRYQYQSAVFFHKWQGAYEKLICILPHTNLEKTKEIVKAELEKSTNDLRSSFSVSDDRSKVLFKAMVNLNIWPLTTEEEPFKTINEKMKISNSQFIMEVEEEYLQNHIKINENNKKNIVKI